MSIKIFIEYFTFRMEQDQGGIKFTLHYEEVVNFYIQEDEHVTTCLKDTK